MRDGKTLTAVKEVIELKNVSPELEARQEAALRGAVKEMRKHLAVEEAVRSGKTGRRHIPKPKEFDECYREWSMGDISGVMAASICKVSTATWYKWVSDLLVQQEEDRVGKHDIRNQN